MLHFSKLGEVEPRFLAQSPLGCWTAVSALSDCPLTAFTQKQSPAQSRVLVGDEKGIRLGNGGPGSPSSPLLILIYFVYVTCGYGNLGPHEAVRSNGNLELPGIICPEGSGRCGEEHRGHESMAVASTQDSQSGLN